MEPDPVIRAVAATARFRISRELSDSVPVLLEVLGTRRQNGTSWTSPEWRRFGPSTYGFNCPMTAAWFLGDIGPAAAEALAALEREAESGPDSIAVVAARAVWKIRQNPGAALPVFRRVLGGDNKEARVIACLCLREIGLQAAPLLQDLQAACKTDLCTRQAAREAIERINSELRKQTPASRQ